MSLPRSLFADLERRGLPPAESIGVVETIQPVMISGVYRSGTTFLSAIVASHPRYRATSSTVKFMRFCFGRFDPLEDPERHEALVRETRRRLNVRWSIDFDVDAVVSAFRSGPLTYARLYDAIMRATLLDGAPDDVNWAEKLAVQWSDIPLFLQMFPNGKVLHIFRDPREVCASYKHLTNETGYAYLDSAFNCVLAMQELPALRERHGADRIHLMRVEDLSTEPRETLRQMCAFLNVEFDARMLKPQRNLPGERWETNTSFGEEITAFDRVEARWPQHLTSADVRFVELVGQPLMSRFGYQGAAGNPDASDLARFADFLADPFIKERYKVYVERGLGSEGYRTDPYTTEMKIVFPERAS